MSDAGSVNANTLPNQINEMAEKIRSMVGKKPGNFDNLVSEYYTILVKIGTQLSVPATAVSVGNITSIQELTDKIVSKLKDGAKTNKVSDDNLKTLYDFFVKYEKALSSTGIVATTTDLPSISEYENVKGFADSGGNRCYQNAALQMFYHIPEFKNFIMNSDNGSTANQIKDAFKMLDSDKPTGPLESCFKDNGQHDAPEYIQTAIFTPFETTEGLTPLNVIDVKQNVKEDGSDLQKGGDDIPKPGIELDFPKITSTSLDKLIAEAQLVNRKGEKTDSADNSGRILSTATTIPDTNRYLYVYLKRGTDATSETSGVKVTAPLPIGDTTLTLLKNPLDKKTPERVSYKLRGFILHMGDGADTAEKKGSGHYVYYWYNEGKWLIFNDSYAGVPRTGKPEENEVSDPTVEVALTTGLVYLYERLTPANVSELVENKRTVSSEVIEELVVPSKIKDPDDIKILVQDPSIAGENLEPNNCFITTKTPEVGELFIGKQWVEYTGTLRVRYKQFWFITDPKLNVIKNDVSEFEYNNNKYNVVGSPELANSGGRRRTRKNKRRITKRKVNKNKNKGKTKKH
jgi:hypothetical protein